MMIDLCQARVERDLEWIKREMREAEEAKQRDMDQRTLEVEALRSIVEGLEERKSRGQTELSEVLHELDSRGGELEALRMELEVTRRDFEGVRDRVGEGEKARSRVEVEIKGLVEERRLLMDQMGEMQVRMEREEREHLVRLIEPLTPAT